MKISDDLLVFFLVLCGFNTFAIFVLIFILWCIVNYI